MDDAPRDLPSGRQRLAGHLVLALVAMLLFVGARAAFLGGLFDYELSPEPGVGAVAGGVGEPEAGEPAAGPPATADVSPEAGETVIDLNALPLRREAALSPVLNPVTFIGLRPAHTQLITYTVRRNDTPNGIAERFNIQPQTLLGCNPRLSEESSLLQTGDLLIICPEDGVLHDVRQSDTLEGLSALYGIPVGVIVAYEPNNLAFPYRLYAGTQIFIPGAVRELFVWTPPELPSRSGGGGGGYPNLGTGTYIWPVASRNISQFFWYSHQAIDIALPEGSPVYASDTGTVSYAAWNNSGYGYLIVVNHGNGFETYYAHLSGFNVIPGQVVSQGDLIGFTGNTGRSSGPHLHFEIRRNGIERVSPLWAGYLP